MTASRRLKWIVVASMVLLLAVVVLGPTIKTALKGNDMFMGLLLRYSKWRWEWRSPSDVGDGKDALQVIIEEPMGIAEDPSGAIYISDRQRFIWKIEPSGRAIVIAGTGAGPGALLASRTPARDADLGSPEGLAIERDGDILFADSHTDSILRLDREGYLTRIVGNGSRGYNGDGKLATETSLNIPHDVRLDSNGNLYIADVMNHRIRKIDGNGIMTTVAGTGVPGYTGDGGPAVAAQLNTPWGILIDGNDHLLIADSENHVIRKVGSDGIIRTIAGSGQRGYDGDGGAALSARFDTPQSMAIDSQGRLYVDDEHNDAIRFIEPDGTVRTLVGTRGPGFSGDGGPAQLAQIADPENLLIRGDGSILITARDNARVRAISPDGTISTFAGRGPTSRHRYYAPIRLTPVDP